MSVTRILIPTDLSRQADYAYATAQALFSSSVPEIHLLSVLTVTPDMLFDERGELVQDGLVDLASMESQRKELEESLASWVKGKANIVATRVKLGRLNNDLIQYIGENAIDMVIMGTEGATGFKEFVSGSHAAQFAMRSPVPVLSVKAPLHSEHIDKVVLAGDFRDPQMVEIGIIKDIIRSRSAKVLMLKVNTPGDFETNHTVTARMKEFAELNEIENPEFHIYCDHAVEKGIASFSEEQAVDIIVIGTQQRSGLGRMIKRSISYELINHLSQAVITFPVK